MPEKRFPIRTWAGIPTLLLLGLALGGCSGGDFGRTREDFRNDDMHRWMGAEATVASDCARRNSSSPTMNASFAIRLIP